MSQAATAPGTPAPFVLELTVQNCAELFDASAPVCLGRQTVHGDIVEHLLEQVAAAPANAAVKLRLNVPADELARADANTAAFREYFEKCRADESRCIKRILWEGRISLAMGLMFLLLASALGEGIRAAFSGRFAGALATGLEIFGWVALWRPAELLLYDWIPVRRKRKLLARLATMEIEYRPINK
jgi:hypothetical protein